MTVLKYNGNVDRVLKIGADYAKWKCKYLVNPSLKRTALASYPRSGNPWVRALIEASTGLEAGSIYSDRFYTRGSEGVVIKTHARDRYRYTKAVVVLREPSAAIFSHYRWLLSFSKTKMDLESHVFTGATRWNQFYSHWLKSSYDIHLVQYEDLKSNTRKSLSSILDYLEFDIEPSKISEAITTCSMMAMRAQTKHDEKSGEFFGGAATSSVEPLSDQQRKYIETETYSMRMKFNMESPVT